MATEDHSYELRYAVKDAPKTKTVGLWIDANDRDLEAKIKRAFNLAKSGGRELDLTVSPAVSIGARSGCFPCSSTAFAGGGQDSCSTPGLWAPPLLRWWEEGGAFARAAVLPPQNLAPKASPENCANGGALITSPADWFGLHGLRSSACIGLASESRPQPLKEAPAPDRRERNRHRRDPIG